MGDWTGSCGPKYKWHDFKADGVKTFVRVTS